MSYKIETRKKILKKTTKTCDSEFAKRMKAKNVENPPLKTAEKWQNLLNFDLDFFLSRFSFMSYN
jgi:hypothetical protein